MALEAPSHPETARRRLADYAELTKARLSALVVLTAAAGYAAAGTAPLLSLRFALAIAGIGLAALGANGLNEWWEIALDARMERTRNRPLPAGRLPRGEALALALALVAAGIGLLLAGNGPLAAGLTLLVVVLYVLVYTPLKTRSTLCTLVGAVCGALPPMIGWAAATGRVDPGAFLLAGILFAWQMPHFLSLAWLYREDYARGGYRMLPVIDREGTLTCAMVVLYSIVLIPLGLLATLGGLAGPLFAAGAVALGVALTALAWTLFRHRTRRHARRVFLASLVYLPLLLGLLIADRGPGAAGSRVAVAEARTALAAPLLPTE